MIRTPLIIFGAGNVGRTLMAQLLDEADLHAERDGLILPVLAWCDSNGALVDDDGLDPAILQAASAAKRGGTPFARQPSGYAQTDLAGIVDVAGTDGCVVVDVTAADATIPALELALDRGYSVATANKIPLTGSQTSFDRLVGSGRFRYESTVGSAVPAIETVYALLRAGDQVTKIRGVFSGTLGFLCTGLQAGKRFSALVADAFGRGATEPDPRVDLAGVDMARKSLILARTLGWRMDLADVQVTSLIPSGYADISMNESMARLPELDVGFVEQVKAAAEEGRVLRYVAELSRAGIDVGLRSVPADSPLGHLRGNDNLFAFQSKYYPAEPLMLQGRGKGVDAAAAGVHADIIALASRGTYL